jgi:glyoxylase-like metal-dependent hydrolase (beta-lactamase superfamily II)
MMLDLEILSVGLLGCNCILLWDTQSKEGVVTDPGGETERISERVKELNISIQAILLTHAHFDHVGDSAALQNLWTCPVFLHAEDFPLLELLNEQTESYGISTIQKPDVTPLRDDLPLGIKFIHTPGHSVGSSTFLIASAKGKTALVGDTLFSKGIGRTDLWGGSRKALENSIQTKLYTLEADTIVIPGHGPATTIGSERRGNPFVRG